MITDILDELANWDISQTGHLNLTHTEPVVFISASLFSYIQRPLRVLEGKSFAWKDWLSSYSVKIFLKYMLRSEAKFTHLNLCTSIHVDTIGSQWEMIGISYKWLTPQSAYAIAVVPLCVY